MSEREECANSRNFWTNYVTFEQYETSYLRRHNRDVSYVTTLLAGVSKLVTLQFALLTKAVL
jgi:hypothetical protein